MLLNIVKLYILVFIYACMEKESLILHADTYDILKLCEKSNNSIHLDFIDLHTWSLSNYETWAMVNLHSTYVHMYTYTIYVHARGIYLWQVVRIA